MTACGAKATPAGDAEPEIEASAALPSAPPAPSFDELGFEPGVLTLTIDGETRRMTVAEREATLQGISGAQSVSLIARAGEKEGLILSLGGFSLDLEAYPFALERGIGSARLRYIDADGVVFTAANDRANAPMTLHLVSWDPAEKRLRGAFSASILGEGERQRAIEGGQFEVALVEPINLR